MSIYEDYFKYTEELYLKYESENKSLLKTKLKIRIMSHKYKKYNQNIKNFVLYCFNSYLQLKLIFS